MKKRRVIKREELGVERNRKEDENPILSPNLQNMTGRWNEWLEKNDVPVVGVRK